MEVFGLDEWKSIHLRTYSVIPRCCNLDQSDTAPCSQLHVHVLYLVSNSQIPPGSLGISGTLCFFYCTYQLIFEPFFSSMTLDAMLRTCRGTGTSVKRRRWPLSQIDHARPCQSCVDPFLSITEIHRNTLKSLLQPWKWHEMASCLVCLKLSVETSDSASISGPGFLWPSLLRGVSFPRPRCSSYHGREYTVEVTLRQKRMLDMATTLTLNMKNYYH